MTEKDNLVFRLGLYGATLTPALASTVGGLRSDAGVLVLARAGTGLTGQNAIEPADVVRAVNGTQWTQSKLCGPHWRKSPDGAPIVLQIERAGMLSYIISGATPGTETDASRRPVPATPAIAPSRRVAYQYRKKPALE